MCDPVTIMGAVTTGAKLLPAVGSVLTSASGASQQGDAASQAAMFAAQQSLMQADQTQAAGYQQAKRIREQGASTVGQANASLAASGVNVGTGTSNDVRQRITQNTEMDALNSILNADTRATALRGQADMDMRSAQGQSRAGGVNALSSVLSGASNFITGWKKLASS
ncbi:hypothetical protein K6W16_10365 [Burkholderia dolosa]|uniref:Uncharacterized protein n=2 Tax=Burkholderia dolosa TaxID=152500 RepID=A0A892I8F3_9BURK|nr:MULTISPECIES: hypothetical protein [Burkholderia]AJY13960.1 hypothetical protein AK34_730 [Burkholderia dolosa AU0158]AYZ97795.1 hypothetical protein EGY28_22825 [Burkholderia dolosa]ETP66803.1 hypothetical protein BDSB_05525 [Burkholderia dolosa PC543]MBR8419801.1 hypothetical protein [Burkholderia dolosa]MBY4657942.1 hypothetical protein [Burkholderia dolosa]